MWTKIIYGPSLSLKYSIFFNNFVLICVQSLYLNGMSMPIRKLDKSLTRELKSSASSSTDLSDLSLTKIETPTVDFSFLTEEIFQEDGTYEELLAYDNQEEEYLFEHNKRLNLSKRRRHGLPPITPKASMKDLVTNFLFDHMWSELINWSSDIIQTYAKTISEGEQIFLGF